MEVTTAVAAAIANHQQLVNNHSSPSHSFQQGSSNCIVITLSQNNSPASSNSELDKELQDLDLNTIENDSSGVGNNLNAKFNGSVSMSSSTSSTTATTTAATTMSTNLAQKTQNKNRISSSRTPTRKAKRIRFYRNGDKFFSGITIPVSTDRYRLDILFM